MKVVGLIACFLAPCLGLSQHIQVIAPAQPVVVGTAFQVQYIITEPAEFIGATTPQFDSCRLVSGPHIYRGSATINGRLQPIQNIAYTLVASRTGVLRIGKIKVDFKNLPDEESADAGISVVPQPKASFSVRSSYTDAALYAPSAKKDREKLIAENLFIKVETDKRTCYEGEPLVAGFTLYSRLQSSSEAEKSPAFYGFSVTDILDINQAHTAVERLNGKIFNTSVLRRVQLYPVQAGRLTIDEMYVQNEIEFEDSVTGLRSTVQKEIVTEPIAITVKPLPLKKPEDFTGAVGSFLIKARLEKKQMPLNGQGKLVVTIQGRGNFIQFGQPVINWPKGIEPFEPSITDRLNKTAVPIEGERVYEFAFTADSIGSYSVLPFSFSFFDVKTGNFKQARSDTLPFHVIKEDKVPLPGLIAGKTTGPLIWILLFLILAGLVTAFILYRSKSKKGRKAIKASRPPDYITALSRLDVTELTETQACVEIQKILSEVSKTASSLSAVQKEELRSILMDCQQSMYSRLQTEGKKQALKERALRLLQSL